MERIAHKGRAWTVLSQSKMPGQYDVTIMRCGDTLAVWYGAEFTTFKVHEDLAAFREYGYCLRHQLECAGQLDVEAA